MAALPGQEMIPVHISRGHAAADDQFRIITYEVPYYPQATVLSALLYIYENIDFTLTFRYGCRFQKCGQCALQINDRPRLACLTYLKQDMVIKPLAKFPVIKDLVIDRRYLWEKLLSYRIYLPAGIDLTQPISPEAGLFKEPEVHKHLMACRDCLCCQAACPAWEGPQSTFGGPYLFVKLAQVFLDPRNGEDHRQQAGLLEIDRCRSCQKCYCPNGIQIYKDAIGTLLL